MQFSKFKDLWQEGPLGRACFMGHHPSQAHASQHPAGPHVWNLMLWGHHLEILNNLSLKLCFVSQVQRDNKNMGGTPGSLELWGSSHYAPPPQHTAVLSHLLSGLVPWEPWKLECNCRPHTSALFGDLGSGVGRVIHSTCNPPQPRCPTHPSGDCNPLGLPICHGLRKGEIDFSAPG